MNFCCVLGKIITDINFNFMIEKKRYSIISFYMQLKNKSIIFVEAYNEIADLCYQYLKKGDNICINGYLDNKNILKIVIEEICVEDKI